MESAKTKVHIDFTEEGELTSREVDLGGMARGAVSELYRCSGGAIVISEVEMVRFLRRWVIKNNAKFEEELRERREGTADTSL